VARSKTRNDRFAALDLDRASPTPRAADAARNGPSPTQWVVAVMLLAALAIFLAINPRGAAQSLHMGLFLVFSANTLWRLLAIVIARPPETAPTPTELLPSYTVIVPLYREAAMVPGLIAALNAIDYPRDRLQIIAVLEEDDAETLQAFQRHPLADRFHLLIAAPEQPKTKPRACNIALAHAAGHLVVVYDAEDQPHPGQLREAAARFAASDPTLACLQAPLRIKGGKGFLASQFALEYAAHFEIMLPALARLGAPFPLGGTSNHFRTDALRAAGGWDAWNVTEDADLGFRLAAQGFRSALLRQPTWENPPTILRDWTLQRRRWIKGYMQTWGVHMRRPLALGCGGLAALQTTLGLAILSAFAHGPLMAYVLWEAAVSFWGGGRLDLADILLLICGWIGAALAMSAGSARANLRMAMIDALLAPVYWALQSWAAVLAAIQLCTRPHYWDKTRHHPIACADIGDALYDIEEASVRRAA
jgi:cellulose synthase/poly-beta-1,6-N-acetylglucosamine synthase-like glycosyltransferase